ncbi:nodulin-26-like isoform X1 [Arachis stenosperma]|uniref:nodulin-26-like isoform X1 n=1 Tax=Arachis stenosperma TaxID=217475 RepID=UPI0025AD3DB4|nr:nodulin-26-like isoform X1 [Arachis stenosperma]
MSDNNNNNNRDVVMSVTNDEDESDTKVTVPLLQKLVAEVVGTFFLIFAGCGSLVVNLNNDKVVTLAGIATVWGLLVMVLIYSLGHISAAHFNPAVTIALASINRFPWNQVPAYIFSQVLGSTLASGALRLLFTGKDNQFPGTVPSVTHVQALVIEFIITFFLMFVISGVATDNRAIGELAGLAVGSTILLNVLVAGPLTGASMNPARSLGPAIVHSEYRGIWVYLVSPIVGAVAGAWTYNFVRYTKKPVREITKSASFFKGSK